MRLRLIVIGTPGFGDVSLPSAQQLNVYSVQIRDSYSAPVPRLWSTQDTLHLCKVRLSDYYLERQRPSLHRPTNTSLTKPKEWIQYVHVQSSCWSPSDLIGS